MKVLRCPLGGWMFRDIEVDNSPSIMREHDEYEQHLQRQGRHEKEVVRDEIVDMQVEKRPLGRRRRLISSGPVLFHR